MRKIKWNDTADTGAESVRLGADAAKKSRRAVRTARDTTRTAVRAAKVTVNVLHGLIVHTVAILISPVTWVILAIGLVLYLLMTLLIILTGVAAQDNNAQHQAYATPVALGEDIPEEITERSCAVPSISANATPNTARSPFRRSHKPVHPLRDSGNCMPYIPENRIPCIHPKRWQNSGYSHFG